MNGEGTNVKKKEVNFDVGSPPNSPLSTGSSPADYHTVLEMSPSTMDTTVESPLVSVSVQTAHNDISINRSLSRFHVSKEQVAPSTIRNTMSDIALQQKRTRTNTDVEKLLVEPTQTPVQANGTNGDVTLAVPRSPRVRPTRHNFSAFSMDNEQWKNGMALYEEGSTSFFANYLKAHTTPGPDDNEQSESGHSKKNLGVMLGVYLPTIQHILGVTMFIRLFWLVGIAGLAQTFLLLFVCCLCTFLTCISISAVATNGVVEGGGPYFLISRNLGPEFGSAVGILFYLANTIATSMYLVGGVEILLLYLTPWLTIGGEEVHSETSFAGMMTHNYRLYGTVLLLIEFLIVAMGVVFVQMLAPVSLVCVILSILACYAGGIEKTLHPETGQYVCMYDARLLQSRAFMNKSMPIEEICNYCNINNTMMQASLCGAEGACNASVLSGKFICKNGYPGFNSNAFRDNLGTSYMDQFFTTPTVKADTSTDVFQDVKTTWFVLLAIYFPAVTGIFTGTNMSGDLKDPQKSIPGGTIAAQLTTSFVYFSLAAVFGAAIDGDVLRDKNGFAIGGNMVVALLSWPSRWVLLIGSFLSTFGAALQCLCSAPRILLAISKDDVIPILTPFKVTRASGEPFRALILTTIIAELAILMGAVDTIAAVVDFFFLMCYGFVNIVCAMHSLMGAPNWRPRFKYYHWSLSMLGAFLCLFIMFSTHWDYSIIAILLCAGIYKYVEYKGAKKEWGDGFRGIALSTAQFSLMKISEDDPHPKNFRPQLLLLLSTEWRKDLIDVSYINLLHLASQLKASKGLTLVTSFLNGDPTDDSARAAAAKVKSRITEDMDRAKLKGFAKTLIHSNNQVHGSMSTLIQSVGLGGLKPNTVLISWPRSDEIYNDEYATFMDKLKVACAMGMSMVIAKDICEFPSNDKRMTGTIDIYCIMEDGGLTILIGWLLTHSKVWRGCKLRVISIAGEHDNNVKMQEGLTNLLYNLRIKAKIKIVEIADPEVSKSAFEHTLRMEERTMVLSQMREMVRNANQAQNAAHGNLLGVPSANAARMTMPIVTAEMKEKTEKINEEDEDGKERRRDSQDSNKSGKTNDDEKDKEAAEKEREKAAKKERMKKVAKMNTAVKLNETFHEHSSDAALILINLPKPFAGEDEVALAQYYTYLGVLTKDLPRVLMIRATGKEVITSQS
ncbi:hypothetical protein WR25_23562 [Diploscapter pachys]|uniref:Amino acid permease/ SLC12A domain-containing protein n=1 Tax=Diploscapter pachys TaxID=2018661 RepID=A0A2A2KKC6_9BILA|nr:hypothetical protein WR25_23562 [Diploscapter pachys]